VIEQALRLAALFHDMGHLPFSHDFEHALNEWHRTINRGDPAQPILSSIVTVPEKSRTSEIHERLSLGVARLLLRDVANMLLNDDSPSRRHDARYPLRSDFTTTVANLTYRILQTWERLPDDPPENNVENAIHWLHSIISGEIDADRCDFLLRDGRNFGFEFAPYNLGRLLDNVIAARSTSGRFVLALRPQGLSSAESFLLSRFRSYQFGVRHHKVAQVGAALRYSIQEVLSTTHSSSEMTRFLGTINALIHVPDRPNGGELNANERALLSSFQGYDDIWWMTKLREAADGNDNEWLALVCWRARGPRSFWKRTSQFADYLEQIGWKPPALDGESENTVAAWNRQRSQEAFAPPEHEAPSRVAIPTGQSLQDAIDLLRIDGVLVTRHLFKPWKAIGGRSERLLIQTENGALVPVSDLSALARALRVAWMEDVQVHAFASSRSAITAIEVAKALTFGREEMHS
jgi:hypothetical protein